MSIIDSIFDLGKWRVDIDTWHGGELRYFWFKKDAIKYFEEKKNSLPVGYMVTLKNDRTDKTIEKWNNLGEPPIFIPSYQRRRNEIMDKIAIYNQLVEIENSGKKPKR